MKHEKDTTALILIVILSTLSACANSGTAILNTLANTNDYTKVRNISYGVQSRNKLDIYNPSISATNKSKNAVIVFSTVGAGENVQA